MSILAYSGQKKLKPFRLSSIKIIIKLVRVNPQVFKACKFHSLSLSLPLFLLLPHLSVPSRPTPPDHFPTMSGDGGWGHGVSLYASEGLERDTTQYSSRLLAQSEPCIDCARLLAVIAFFGCPGHWRGPRQGSRHTGTVRTETLS